MSTAKQLHGDEDTLPGIIELTPEESEALLDEEARRFLGMSGADFRRAWLAGEFVDRHEDRHVQRIAILLGADYDAA